MKKIQLIFAKNLSASILFSVFLMGCMEEEEPVDLRIKRMDPEESVQLAKTIESEVNPELAEGLSLRLGVDSLVADPIAIDIDNKGHLYYTRTNRQTNSEFDIRGHQDWETESIRFKRLRKSRLFCGGY